MPSDTQPDEIVLKVKVKKSKKPKKEKPKRDLKSVFRQKLKEVTVETLQRPWMAEKSLRLVDTVAGLEAWAEGVLADVSRHYEWGGETSPALAVDTETVGLDTRILMDIQEKPDGTWEATYECKIEIAGVCLSADGIEGIYVPIFHEKGNNVPRQEVARILQYLFDRCHLIFYNAKFDREVLRITLGLDLRPYPFFEDVQVLKYINDPKADLGDRGKFSGDAGGLKALSKAVLGIEQVEMSDIAKVKAHWDDPVSGKKRLIQQVVPFTWIPTRLAVWYAAGDAICTWLLWAKMKDKARGMRLVHHIDHELVETLTWVERQRFTVDTDRQRRTAAWHHNKTESLRTKLREMALAAGYEEEHQVDGTVLEDDKFNPGSPQQLGKLLFQVMKFKPYKTTDTGVASTDKEVIQELTKAHPENEFLQVLHEFRNFSALHPGNLKFDPKDRSARIYLKQNVVAGGRLSAAGGEFDRDGGFELNPQGVKKIEREEMWRVYGNVLEPDTVPLDQIETYTEADLHPSCFEQDEKTKVISKAPGIINNHIGLYQGYAICLVPSCKTCKDKFGILISETSMDANEQINLRVLFMAPKGWSFFSLDYSNIEVRAAANLSKEPELENIFLYGEGDHHSLTASKVFPGYSDPTSKDYKSKVLRALAKIINFALQYGGTEYTIFENMKKKDPSMTRERAKKMVDDYWAGVPKFAEWCEAKKYRAKHELLCETATGRVIDFKSAMEADRLRPPVSEEFKQMQRYYDFGRRAERAKEAGDMDAYARLKSAADSLWKNPETGVRNAIDYNRFIGKIQRVSVNVPVQGICGDFMRIALNRIRIWVLSDPAIQSVFRLHGSVHDEIDPSIKNEYVPFILPRLTRLMKLRKYHEKMGWKVPIECDAEYGHSWDVDYNVTDKKHPDAYTHIPGIETYVPDCFDLKTVKGLLKALSSGIETRIQRAKGWLQTNLHPRAYEATVNLFKATELEEIKNSLIAVLQLHEFWVVDNTPDDDNSLETLAQYEKRMGLTEKDRGSMPEFGFLGKIPLNFPVTRPIVDLLGDESELTPPTSDCPQGSLEFTLTEESKPANESVRVAMEDLPELKDIAPFSEEARQLRLALGKGPETIRVVIGGQVQEFRGRGRKDIPQEFLKVKEIPQMQY
jgi:DNA polymerase I-like protein with 3'-5' exonuclease and polymerase domains